MQTIQLSGAAGPLNGSITLPGDKSLSHRAIIFGSLAKGRSVFTNVLSGEDCVCTREAFEALGVHIESRGASEIVIEGKGLRSLQAPSKEIYLGNSGTSIRLLMGILAAQPFEAVLTGDPSLSGRPMRRVTDFLKKMGADIQGRDNANFAPLTIRGGVLSPIDAVLPVASAQVKSAILLAGLYANGTTRVTEPVKSRDHTERFLKYFGAKVNEKDLSVSIEGGQELQARNFEIAGDISSAAFFIVMALLVRGSELRFKSVLWNPTRTGLIEVLKRMGARVEVQTIREEGPEPVADFTVRFGSLKAFEIKKEELPSLIDEIPILTVLATQAHGTSVIHEADELRVKETDRIRSMSTMLSRMGAKVEVEGNTLKIHGPIKLHGADLDSFKDHRTAMSLIAASLVAEGRTSVKDVECINTSFPSYFELLKQSGIAYQRIDTP